MELARRRAHPLAVTGDVEQLGPERRQRQPRAPVMHACCLTRNRNVSGGI
jgi:hypothetical protein